MMMLTIISTVSLEFHSSAAISLGWGGNSQIKVTWMLFVSLTGGNCRFLGSTYSGVSKIVIGITGLRENFGRNDGIAQKFGSR